MIIDTSYFQYKPVYIPNSVTVASALPNPTPTAKSQVQQFIDSKEYELLLSALGHEQLTELLSQFTETGAWIEEPLQKWVDLVDGKDEWRGLRYTYGTNKISLIAYYVFYFYLTEDFKTYNTTGIQVSQSENAISAAPNDKTAKAWNEFVRMYNGFDIGRYGTNMPTFFNNWNGTGMMWAGNNKQNQISLYDFMTKNNDIYDTGKFTLYPVINSFGL